MRPAIVSRRAAAIACCCIAGAMPISAQPAPRPAAGGQPLAQSVLVSRVRTLADAMTRADQFSGVILLARGGTPVFEQAYGYADRETKRRATVATTFNVASLGKLFTQSAVGQLVAAGTLSPDSTISAYWPDYPDAVAARTVTIRQLLEHRSGIQGNIFENPLTRRSNRDNVPAATRHPLAFAPGSRQQYSNAGYVVLGEIIERVSGEVYHEYIRRHVFAAAGMTASGFPAIDSLPAGAAVGYTRGGDPDAPAPAALPPLSRSEPLQPRRGSAAGGSYSNVHDLLRFVRARREGTLGVPARRSREMVAGGSPGTNGIIAEGLPDEYDLIVLANMDPPSASVIADSVERWLGGAGGGPGAMGGPRRVVRAPGGAGEPQPAPQGARQATLPDTPQGRTAGAYLRAFSSGDTAVMRTFIASHAAPNGRSVDDRIRQYQEIFADLGPLTLLGVRVAPDASLALDVRSAKNGELMIRMAFTPGTPDRVAGIEFRVER
ncbi:MAG: beta-lactamase family protein [Gemmatimonadaceae bacterium]|jgi:CubicO group peptidase (beta-lactamase class C family)|nr:beta-lactamase family protein [Gemmatimonadaceae bacterium]